LKRLDRSGFEIGEQYQEVIINKMK
jgi:FtsP/CotA-like multicopper oxidase with cupredoxin domain